MTHRTVAVFDAIHHKGWLADWQRYWGLADAHGWTETLTDEAGGNPIRVLREDADCLVKVGIKPPFNIDVRESLTRLQRIGWQHGYAEAYA